MITLENSLKQKKIFLIIFQPNLKLTARDHIQVGFSGRKVGSLLLLKFLGTFQIDDCHPRAHSNCDDASVYVWQICKPLSLRKVSNTRATNKRQTTVSPSGNGRRVIAVSCGESEKGEPYRNREVIGIIKIELFHLGTGAGGYPMTGASLGF